MFVYRNTHGDTPMRHSEHFDPLLKIGDIVRNPHKGGHSLLPISRSTFLRGVDLGIYPKPVRIRGSNMNYWRLSEIEAIVKGAEKVKHSVGGQ